MKVNLLIASLCASLFMAASGCAQGLPDSEKNYVNNTLYPATALLYSRDAEGGMSMRCTATNIEEDSTGYTFLSASHCGCNENSEKNIVSPEKADFFISPDIPGNQLYLRATPIACGFRHRGDDFFLVKTDKTIKFPVIPIGQNPKVMDAVINVGGPLGLGREIFTGTIASADIDRPIKDGDINWQHAIAIEMFGINGGSSGSALVCINQHAICAVLVGSVEETTIVAIPIDRFVKFRKDLAIGNYKWYRPDSEAPPETPASMKSRLDN